jgi:hypothetical protein
VSAHFIMCEKDNTGRVFEGVTAWMDSADTMDLAELRQVRRMMGDNVEESEREFLSWLGNLKGGLGEAATALEIESILSSAKKLGLEAPGLADATGLSVVLVMKLDRRLIDFGSIPEKILDVLASALHTATAVVTKYLQQPPVLAMGARFRANENPKVSEPQNFFDAVRSDRSISEERRGALLALSGKR